MDMNPFPVGVTEGMSVRDLDGRRVGKVIRCEATRFIVERGLLLTRWYQVGYDDVLEAREDDLVIRSRRDDLLEWIPGAGTREGILEATEGDGAGDDLFEERHPTAGRTVIPPTHKPLI
jgi:hypothetical protein